MSDDLPIGSFVVLASGGPTMVVTARHEELYVCEWKDDAGQPLADIFSRPCLVHIFSERYAG